MAMNPFKVFVLWFPQWAKNNLLEFDLPLPICRPARQQNIRLSVSKKIAELILAGLWCKFVKAGNALEHTQHHPINF